MLAPAAIDHIAALARLDLTDAERALLAAQLAAIIGYVDQLQAIDSGGLADDAALPIRPVPTAPALRLDVPAPSLPRDLALANAPVVESGQFRVPGFLPEDG